MTVDVLDDATTQARDVLLELEHLLGQIGDADLHRAEPDGGWTCAQVVSHIHLCGLLWIADVERVRRAPSDHVFMFREEIGHDTLGAPPPSTRDAAERIASLRTALEQCLPQTEPALLQKSLEVPTLGTYTIQEWLPIINGHLAGHVEQIKSILRSRGVLPPAVTESGTAEEASGPDV